MEKELTGIERISKERIEQLEKHGITIASDQQYDCGELLYLARWLMACPVDEHRLELSEDDADMDDFIFDGYKGEDMFEDDSYVKFPIKMRNDLYKKPYLEKLAIAGALVAAEIDRIQNK